MHIFKKEAFIIHTKYKNYTCLILTTFDTISKIDIRYDIHLGGKDKGCVSISVPSNTNFMDLTDNSVASISSIHYNKNCDTKGHLQSGVGTKHMIRTSLNIVMEMYPWIKTFSLRDVSSKKCNPTNNTEFSLAKYYIALYGMTWYEKHFGAELENQITRQAYMNRIQLLKNPSVKPKKYKQMRSFFGIKNDKQIKIQFETSATFQDFFDSLNHNMDKEQLCDFLEPWIEIFMDNILDENIHRFLTSIWVIIGDKVEKIELKTDWKQSISIDEYFENSYSLQDGGDTYKTVILDGSE